jgi:hypothetical protein
MSLVLVPVHLYGFLEGDVPLELHHAWIIEVLMALTIFALVLLLASWAQIFIQLYRDKQLPFKQRVAWALVVLMAPYGLIIYYFFVYRTRYRNKGQNYNGPIPA